MSPGSVMYSFTLSLPAKTLSTRAVPSIVRLNRIALPLSVQPATRDLRLSVPALDQLMLLAERLQLLPVLGGSFDISYTPYNDQSGADAPATERAVSTASLIAATSSASAGAISTATVPLGGFVGSLSV